MFEYDDEVEFEKAWDEMIQKYDVGSVSWLDNIYKLKTKWAMLELVAYINTKERPSRRERNERHDSDVHGIGYFKDFLNTFIQVGFFSYIYVIDVTLNH